MKNKYTTNRLLSYVVAYDQCLAPNVTGGICTLSVCKPVVRRVVVPGEDMIIGLSTAAHRRNGVIYAMQVDEKISFADYFKDLRFQCKKSPKDTQGDNFFKKINGKLQLAFKGAAHVGNDRAIKRDLKTPVAVIGHTFWYFGENAPGLPSELQDTSLSLNDTYRRGHRVTTDPKMIKTFTHWLGQWSPGIHGTPRDLIHIHQNRL